MAFEAPGGPFTVTAKADRIELRGRVADVLDFKTGSAPSAKQVQRGLSPQLTLTAAILQAGGFADDRAGRARRAHLRPGQRRAHSRPRGGARRSRRERRPGRRGRWPA